MAFTHERRDPQDGPRRNEAIRAREVRVAGADGAMIGVMPIFEALRLAKEQELDLVEVSPNVRPPVCRLMDWGRFQYEKRRKDKEVAKKRNVAHPKEVQFRPNIEDADLEVKLKHLRGFLEEGRQCRLSVFFRGREIVRKERGINLLKRVGDELADMGKFDAEPRLEGKRLFATLSPITKSKVQEGDAQ